MSEWVVLYAIIIWIFLRRLTAALSNAECYKEAYYSLSDEVGSLLARNQIAEEEVDRISQFNAEILGHHNPAQRIMYVDRIRRELAEAKQVRSFEGLDNNFVDEIDFCPLILESCNADTWTRKYRCS